MATYLQYGSCLVVPYPYINNQADRSLVMIKKVTGIEAKVEISLVNWGIETFHQTQLVKVSLRVEFNQMKCKFLQTKFLFSIATVSY